MCSKVLNGHIILTDTSITTILAPEMTYTPKKTRFPAKSGLSCHGKALPLLADVEKAGMRAAARAK